jgi:threonyl-tRNA synthetase
MREILKRKEDFTRKVITKENALALFSNQKYKLELINDLPEDSEISVYATGDDFVDLCSGPHVENSARLLNWSFKVANVAGAYWRGDEKNAMLSRIYVYAFPTKQELKDYLNTLEEAKRRDHRKLGPALDLFFMDDSAPGMPYWLPKGWKMFNALLDFWREEHEKRGYQEISSPQINRNDLWLTSGHWEHYKDNMFVIPIDENNTFAVKPMNCPNAMIVYKRKTRSYRDLPLRFSDCDVLHRNEVSGTLHGLLRVQMFRQDDSHNFITPDQISSEINNILDLADIFYKIFGLSYKVALSTRPPDFMGDPALWDKAESELKEVLDNRYGSGAYELKEGDGAFYGPKIDIMMKDALNRVWQTGTIQLDFQLPQNFGLTYADKDGELKTPVVIHRVVYGSLERFIGILIEEFEGAFPFWISPTQVFIAPIHQKINGYGREILEILRANKIRAEIDEEDASMGSKLKKIRAQKIPYALVLGDRESNAGTVSVKCRSGEQINDIDLNRFLEICKKANSERTLTLDEKF